MKLSRLGKSGRIALAVGAAGAASAIGLLAVPATFGGFTSSASNANNSAAAGTLEMTDGVSGAVVTASNLDPSNETGFPNSKSGTVLITNSGTLPATMTLSVGSVTDKTCLQNTGNCQNGAGTGSLSGEVNLTITDDATPTPNTIFSGTVDADALLTPQTLPPTTGSQWTPGESHTYTVTVTLPGTAGDAYQGTSTTFALSWVGAS